MAILASEILIPPALVVNVFALISRILNERYSPVKQFKNKLFQSNQLLKKNYKKSTKAP